MQITRLTSGLLDQVSGLENLVFEGRDPWPRVAFDTELRNPDAIWLVALEAGIPIAYAGGWCVPPEFHLLNLAVHLDYRRSGTATGLLSALFAEGVKRGCGSVVLEVRHDNAGAIKLYEKLGFSRVSSRAKYYTAGEDALVYIRPAGVAGAPGR